MLQGLHPGLLQLVLVDDGVVRKGGDFFVTAHNYTFTLDHSAKNATIPVLAGMALNC